MNTIERESWLASLKPGDKVAVECNYTPDYGYDYVIKTVEQITTTGYILLAGGEHYRPDGTALEQSPWSAYGWGDPCYKLVEITPAIETNARRAELLARITAIKWDQLSCEMLEKISQLLDGDFRQLV